MDILFTLVIGLALGYYTVCRVPSVFHAPLMSLTNGVSSICIVVVLEALLKVCAAPTPLNITISCLAGGAMLMLSLNIAGGFYITQRMIDFFYPQTPHTKDTPQNVVLGWLGGAVGGLATTGLIFWILG